MEMAAGLVGRFDETRREVDNAAERNHCGIVPSDQKAGLIFISYSHHDHHRLKSLRSHLAALESSGKAIVWDDARIEPGMHWEPAIFNKVE
jgi:hypothetical protein